MAEFPQHQHGSDAVYSAHTERFGQIEARLGGLEQRVSRMEPVQEALVEGVSNFRDFQRDGRDFFARADERAKNEKAFHEKRDSEIKADMLLRHQENQEKLGAVGSKINMIGLWVAILSLLTMAFFGWLGMKAAHASDLHELFLHSRAVPALESKANQHDAGSTIAVHY